MPGIVLRMFVKPGHGLPMREVESVSAIAGQGLEGDASFGRSRRQVLLVDRSMLGAFGLQPGETRENIVLDGIRLASLAVGTHLRLGGAVLEVTGDCPPCDFMDSIRPGLREAIHGQRGLLARVHSSGLIRVSDPVTVELAEPE